MLQGRSDQQSQIGRFGKILKALLKGFLGGVLIVAQIDEGEHRILHMLRFGIGERQ